ncbi:MAG: hypothetical protein IJO98_04750 [Clostridia bacterium]|nr:hypothetical protein [Clostridia bacterium]
MKTFMKSFGWLLAGGIILIPFTQMGEGYSHLSWAAAAFWCCVAGMIAMYAVAAWDVVRARKAAEDEGVPDVAADRERTIQYQAELELDHTPERDRILSTERRVWRIWAILLTLNIAGAFFLGAAYGAGETPAIVYGVTVMWQMGALLAFALCRPKLFEIDKGTEILEKEAPQLFAMVREVAAQSGHKRPVKLFIGSQGVGVFREKKYDGILLPALLVSYMTKDELKQALRHEFAHLNCEELQLEYDWRRLMARMDWLVDDMPYLVIGFLPMMPAMAEFRGRVMNFLALIERKLEEEADNLPLTPDEARSTVSAIAKSEQFVRFCAEDRKSTFVCYAPETPSKEHTALRGEVFREMIRERGAMWIREMESEKPAQFDTHPTFSQRREKLGVAEYDPFKVETDEGWKREMQVLCDKDSACHAMDSDYPMLHSRYYVHRKAFMDAYEKSADPMNKLKTQELMDAAEAYFGLDSQKAIGIIREVVSRNPKNMDAQLMLGLWLLDGRNDEGLEILYHVAEHGNYTERALQDVGDYVFRSGRDDLISDYQRRSAELLQDAAHFHYRLDEIRLNELKPLTMPQELLEQLVDEMVRAGGDQIEAIGCAAKTYTSVEDAHVFVVKFKDNEADESRCEEIYADIFDILDERDENYALRTDAEMPLKKLEAQVPGCTVYKKEDR